METVTLNRFNRGITNDPRFQLEGVCRTCTGFDAITDQYRLTPYRDSEDGDSSSSTRKIQNFAIALGASSTYKLFGLGVVSGTGRAQIYSKELTTSSGDLSDASWATPSNGASASGSTAFGLFVFYKRTGLLYGARSGSHIWAADPTNAASFDNSEQALTYTNIAQGLVHSKDDIMYVPYDNNIASNNNGSWNNTALVLPTHLYVTSIAEYGNYLAIGCAPLSGVGESVVYLWDRDSSLSTVTQSIPWGNDILKILDVVDGQLIGVSLSGNSTTRILSKVVFRQYVGGDQQNKFLEIVSESSSAQLPIAKRILDNRLFFMMSVTLNGSVRDGVWSIGRSASNEPFALMHERTPNNDAALTNGVLYNFYYVGDYLFQSFVDNAVETMTKTNNSSSYTAKAIYETIINPGMKKEHRFKEKQLQMAAPLTEPLASGEQLVLQVRVDAGDWNTVVTHSTDGDLTLGMGILADGTGLPKGREFEFRLESTGGAVPTGLVYGYTVTETNIGS